MNRNAQIALGCGGAGCLGVIVVVLAGAIIWTFSSRSFTSNRNRSYNFNINSRSNSNSNSDHGSNSNSSSTSDPGTNSESSTTSSSLSDDDKHKLFQAAGMTNDSALIQRVLKKIGLVNESGTPQAGYEGFVKDHFTWAMKNISFINSINTPDKARAYVEQHLND